MQISHRNEMINFTEAEKNFFSTNRQKISGDWGKLFP